MANEIVRCQICGRQIIQGSDENTERTVGLNYGDGRCLCLVNGIACPRCAPEEIEFQQLMEGGA